MAVNVLCRQGTDNAWLGKGLWLSRKFGAWLGGQITGHQENMWLGFQIGGHLGNSVGIRLVGSTVEAISRCGV